MPGVPRDREQRALLPFEDMTFAVVVEPHLGGAAAVNDQIDFLVEVLFRIERAGPRHLDDVAAPFALGAVELDIAPFAAQPLPRRKRQILHLAHADIGVDRDAFRFHEQVVRRLRPAELAEPGSVVAGRLMPMRPAGQFVHLRSYRNRRKSSRLNALSPCRRQGKPLVATVACTARPAASNCRRKYNSTDAARWFKNPMTAAG